ncbi:hypothetical protein [Nocardioides speluncae]|uniref:hypothetical protein n=1 Tax=Nocardioides speluncae TaxID=2670337 RepID=UPI0012B175E8|nr:hypothetical protein [Nocardioides speluncae]
MSSKQPQRWDLDVAGHHHRVEVVDHALSRSISWYVDDELVAQKKSGDENVELEPEDELDEVDAVEAVEAPDPRGALGLKFTTLGRPRRVTWHEPDDDLGASARAALGTGGIDLVPEPGSKAAIYEQKMRDHPRRYAVQRVAVAVVGVVLPILLGLLAVRFAVSIPWPDINLPSIPVPDLPNIPWPEIPWPDINLPSIPFPDLPDWQLPAWLSWLLDHLKYIWPIGLALLLALGEIDRRKKQDKLRADRATAAEPTRPVLTNKNVDPARVDDEERRPGPS